MLPLLPPSMPSMCALAPFAVDVLDQTRLLGCTRPLNDVGPTDAHAVPTSLVHEGKKQPKLIAPRVVAAHSSRVGNRQSPGEEPSVRPHAPSCTPAAA